MDQNWKLCNRSGCKPMNLCSKFVVNSALLLSAPSAVLSILKNFLKPFLNSPVLPLLVFAALFTICCNVYQYSYRSSVPTFFNLPWFTPNFPTPKAPLHFNDLCLSCLMFQNLKLQYWPTLLSSGVFIVCFVLFRPASQGSSTQYQSV